MNLGLRELAAFLARHENDNSLVLATVTATEGSSYRKPGAMMLIAGNREFAGLISGGCLEGDLVEHADAVFDNGQPRQVSYDLSADDDNILGLGLGCGGVIHLLLQRLDREEGFAFLPAMLKFTRNHSSCLLALVIKDGENLPLGTWSLVSDEGKSLGAPGLAEALAARLGDWGNAPRFRYSGQGDAVLMVKVDPSPGILICGAGPDAVPVARQVDALGWDCTVVDHRGAYARQGRFPDSTTVLQIQPAALHEQVSLDQVDAAIVMSHNLGHDNTYLRQLSGCGLAYLGLLGPRARREQLQEDPVIAGQRIHGPAGFDIGAELPESIALSIVAEMHSVLCLKLNRSE